MHYRYSFSTWTTRLKLSPRLAVLAVALALLGCGGGADGGGVSSEPSVELIDESSVRSSGELLRFQLDGIQVPDEPLDGLVDGSIPVTLAPVGGQGLALFLPELADGGHSLSFRIGGVQRVFSIDTLSEALPEDLEAAADDYFDLVESSINATAFDHPTIVSSGDRDAYGRAVAGARADFLELGLADQQRVIRIVQATLEPLIESSPSSDKSLLKQLSACEVDSRRIVNAIAKMVVSVAAVSHAPLLGPVAGTVVFLGATAAFASAYADLDAGFEDFGIDCFVDPILDFFGADTASRATQKATVAGAEFQEGVASRLQFRAEGAYPDVIVSSVRRLQAATQRIVDAVFPLLPDAITDPASRVTNLVLGLPLEERFEPDMSGYAVGEVSDSAIQGEVSGGMGFLDLRFTSDSASRLPEVGLPFSVQLMDQATDRTALPPVDLDGRLFGEGEARLAYSGSFSFYRNGVQHGVIDVPDTWTDMRVSEQPVSAGTVMIEADRTIVFSAASDFVGTDNFEVRAVSEGAPVKGELSLTVFQNCRVVENNGDIIREENCVFDVEPGLRTERNRTLRMDNSVEPEAQYLSIQQSRLTMTDYLSDGSYVADDRRVLTEFTEVLDSGGNAESVVVTRERREHPIGEDGFPIKEQVQSELGSLAPGVRLASLSEVNLETEPFSRTEINCLRDSEGDLKRVTSVQDESGQRSTTETNDEGLSFSEFCGTRDDVDQINDLEPTAF